MTISRLSLGVTVFVFGCGIAMCFRHDFGPALMDFILAAINAAFIFRSESK